MSSEMTSQDVLELLTSSHEYEELPVRHNEDSVNSELAQQLPVPVCNTNYDFPSTKAHLLLHAHFSRTPLPSTDYVTDLKTILDQAIRILQVTRIFWLLSPYLISSLFRLLLTSALIAVGL